MEVFTLKSIKKKIEYVVVKKKHIVTFSQGGRKKYVWCQDDELFSCLLLFDQNIVYELI